ncbi:MAG: hypothetical protein KH828_07680 [Clostridiales bacterium]|nr:hypothetical protein [Clostridiales bacterium]
MSKPTREEIHKIVDLVMDINDLLDSHKDKGLLNDMSEVQIDITSERFTVYMFSNNHEILCSLWSIEVTVEEVCRKLSDIRDYLQQKNDPMSCNSQGRSVMDNH